MLKAKANKSGFTIIEVVITIAIGAAVMALVLNAVQNARRAQRNTNRGADISAVTAAVNQYNTARNELPTATANIEPYLNELAHYTTANIDVGTQNGTLATTALNTTFAAATHTAATGGLILKVAQDANADQIVVLGDAECAADDQPVATGNISGTNGLIADGGLREMVIIWRLESDPNIFCEEI